MNQFPHNDLKPGDLVRGRIVRFRGEKEEDAVFGDWQEFKVSHVQKDQQGRISGLKFAECDQEFDPRMEYHPTGVWRSLGDGDVQFQFEAGE